MKGLEGFLIGLGVWAATFVVLLITGIYCLIADTPNLSLLYASLAAFGVMCIFGFITYADDHQWLDFPNSLYDTLGTVFPLTAAVAGIVVFAIT